MNMIFWNLDDYNILSKYSPRFMKISRHGIIHHNYLRSQTWILYPVPKFVLGPSIKIFFILYKRECKINSVNFHSQTFVYSCHCRIVLMVRRMVQVVLVVLILVVWGEVQTLITPTENRVRVWILVSVPVSVLCAGVWLLPPTGHAPLLSYGTTTGAGGYHVPVVSADAYRDTADVKGHPATWSRWRRSRVRWIRLVLDHVYRLAEGPDVIVSEP